MSIDIKRIRDYVAKATAGTAEHRERVIAAMLTDLPLLLDRVEQLEKDRARLDWLMATKDCTGTRYLGTKEGGPRFETVYYSTRELIDAAMAQTSSRAGEEKK